MFEWILQREHFTAMVGLFVVLWLVATVVAAKMRRRPRAYWYVFGAIGPLFGVLWFVYNAILDWLGSDSLAALVINVAVFAPIGIGVGYLLNRHSGSSADTDPNAHHSEPANPASE